MSVKPTAPQGTGKVTQSFERPLCLSFLVKRDTQHHEDKAQKHQGFLHVSENQVNRATREQQQKHRLSNHFPGSRKDATAFRGGKLVEAVLLQSDGAFGFREAVQCVCTRIALCHSNHAF